MVLERATCWKSVGLLVAGLAMSAFQCRCPPCGGSGGSGGTTTLAIAPRCTILANTLRDSTQSDRVRVAERTTTTTPHGFTAFRSLTVPQNVTASIATNANVYGISEAWFRNPSSPVVVRAVVAPASRPGTTDLMSSAWFIQSQDQMNVFAPPWATGSANRGNEVADRDTAGLTVPQLMPVGEATTQMFACAGSRTTNLAQPTTWFVEVFPPPMAPSRTSRVGFIQDVLNGDDYFIPNDNSSGLVGPSAPPSPTISGPGNPVRSGAVRCAMTQAADNVATRELHLLTVNGGRLYHSMLGNFGPVTNPSFNRFRSVSPWADVTQALGVNFGAITSAAIVASRPTAISIFFVAQSGGRYRLWHTVRFSPGGSWRPADEVWRLSGDAPTGNVYEYQVAAGLCPAPGAATFSPATSEVVVAQWGGPNRFELLVHRVVSTPQQWRPGVTGIYSPWMHLGSVSNSSQDAQRNFRVPHVAVTARPWADDGRP